MLRFASIVLVLGVTRAAAAEPETVFTESGLVSTALAQNRALRARLVERDVARAGEAVAATIPNPAVRVEWLHAQNGDPFDSGWGVGLSWKPPQPGVYAAQRKEAAANSRAVELESLEDVADLEAAVRTEWATSAELGALYELAERMVETRRAVRALVIARVDRGASTRLDVSASTLAVARAEQERDEIGVERESSLRRLRALAGLPVGTIVRVPAATHSVPATAPASADTLRARALADRGLLRADGARATQRTEALHAEEARRWPWINLAAAPRYRMNDQTRYPHDLSAAIEVTLPIFDWNTGRIEAAKAGRRRQAELHAAHVAAVESEIEDARAEVVRRGEILERHRAIVAPLIDEHAALVREALAGQRLDLTALLTADELAQRAQRQEVEARLAYRRAAIRLQRATGIAETR